MFCSSAARQANEQIGAQAQRQQHTTLELDDQVIHTSARSELLSPPKCSLEKDVVVIVQRLNGEKTQEYRFKHDDICKFSARMHRLCDDYKSSSNDIQYIYTEHLDNFFAHYERWIRTSKLPWLRVTVGDSRDVLLLWISMYEMAREFEDWRMVAAINSKIIDIANIGMWSFFKPSVKVYMKKADKDDELRCLLLDLHVARFNGHIFKRYFWRLSPKVSAEILRRRVFGERTAVDKVSWCCAYHQHDHLFKQEECALRATRRAIFCR